jgi:hypothetical protein
MGKRKPTGNQPSVLADMTRGALQGDFAPELGLPGAATQVALTFVPVVGTLCGIRDAAADRRRGDYAGVALNLLSVIPVVGGVAKAVELGRHARRLKRGWVVSNERRKA